MFSSFTLTRCFDCKGRSARVARFVWPVGGRPLYQEATMPLLKQAKAMLILFVLGVGVYLDGLFRTAAGSVSPCGQSY